MNQRTIEQWSCPSRYTSVKKSLTSESQQQLMAKFSKAITLSPMYTCTVMKLGMTLGQWHFLCFIKFSTMV